ncbi:hypothetical protein B1790_01795 [Mycobacterium sp. AT1]|nr:hypothetical protein B1790_01795 [Mycobacterium sp. AT1]
MELSVLFGEFDAVVCPITPTPAFLHDHHQDLLGCRWGYRSSVRQRPNSPLPEHESRSRRGWPPCWRG